MVSGETTDFFRDDVSESDSSHEQWSSPRYLASPLPAPRAMVSTHGAGSRTKADHQPGGAGAVMTPGQEPLVRPAAEPPESGSDAHNATDPMKLLSQLAAQFQIQQQQQAAERRLQQERQAHTDGMMLKLMEQMMHLQSPNLTPLPPQAYHPGRTEPSVPASVRQCPPVFCPPLLLPEERNSGYAGPASPPPDARGGSPTPTSPGSGGTDLHKHCSFS